MKEPHMITVEQPRRPLPVEIQRQREASVATTRDRRRVIRRRDRIADALVSVIVGSVAMAIALWLAAGGLREVRDIASLVTAAGIIAGLVGTDLLLIMLLFAARIPLLDRTFGLDRVMRVHRALGKPSLLLLFAHAGLLILGAMLADHVTLVSAVTDMLSGEDILPAVGGLALMVLVVVSSLIAVRRHLPYEAWHVIHLLSYAAVLLAVPHQLTASSIMERWSWQWWYWLVLYTIVVGSLGWYRFLVPLRASLHHSLTVEHVQRIGGDAVLITMRGEHIDELGIVGGQYAIWRFWSRTTFWHAHPISFAGMPSHDRIQIVVRELGDGTRRLGRLTAGTRVSMEGPYGAFTAAARRAPKLVLVAAGIGITPIRALLEHSRLLPGEATLLMRASSPAEAYLWESTRRLVESRGGRAYLDLGPRATAGSTWLSDAASRRGVTITSTFPDLLDADVYVCGPQAWSDSFIAEARANGVPAERIHTERFDA